MPVGTVVCAHETRPHDLPGLKLLLLSLVEHCAATSVEVTYAPFDAAFAAWTADLPDVSLTALEDTGLAWSIKPQRLIELLDAGWDEVIWMDSDVLLTADPRHLWAAAPEVLVAAMEPPPEESSVSRTRGWDLKVGRELPVVNSCVMRITQAHRGFLEAWAEMLRLPSYVKGQRLPWEERPNHLMSDQDALTALLGSVEFSDMPIKLLRNGRDVIQLNSPAAYSVTQRLSNGRSLAPIVHAQRIKPWRYTDVPQLRRDPAGYYKLVFVELSPYLHVARGYRDRLGQTTPWMDVRSQLGRALRTISNGHVNYQGLPQAAVDRIIGGAYRPRFLGGE
jgi:hypothetical protein